MLHKMIELLLTYVCVGFVAVLLFPHSYTLVQPALLLFFFLSLQLLTDERPFF